MSNTSKPTTEKDDIGNDAFKEAMELLSFDEPESRDDRIKRLKSLKVIKTARGMDAINKAEDEGYTPLLYEVKPSKKYIQLGTMYEMKLGLTNKDMDIYYDPYRFPPYAAYLLPDDLKKGERVILYDLIEDLVGMSRNGYILSRQNSAEAV